MALASATVWEVRTTGAADNGGGWNPARGGASVDYSQQNAAQATISGTLSTPGAASTTLVDSGNGFAAGHVGNLIYISTGTNFVAGFYEIVTFNAANQVVLDRSPTPSGAGASGSGKVGGANSDLQAVTDAIVGENQVWVQAGTYALGATWGIPDTAAGSPAVPTIFKGYTTVRGDAIQPVANIDGEDGSYHLMTFTASADYFAHMQFHFFNLYDANTTGNYRGISNERGRNILWYRCKVENVGGGAFHCPEYSQVMIDCEAVDWSQGDSYEYGFYGSNGGYYINCVARDTVGSLSRGYLVNPLNYAIDCLAVGCYDGFLINVNSEYYAPLAIRCVDYGARRASYILSNTGSTVMLLDCIAVGSATYAIDMTASAPGATVCFRNFNYYDCSSGAVEAGGNGLPYYLTDGTSASDIHELDRDPFVDAANGDFRLRGDVKRVDGTNFYASGHAGAYLWGGILQDHPQTPPGMTPNVRHPRRT